LQLSAAELKIDRLNKAFKIKIREVRETCFQLFGYALEISDTGERADSYKIRSMYAENKEADYFLFKSTKTGIELLETDFSKQWEEQLQTYLAKFHSIPAFLSAVTIELFTKNSMHG